MAKKDSISQMIEDGTEMGRENATLLPEIKNWCKHIILDDISGGLIAATGLPTNVHVSCPHASGGTSGMNLKWIANSFIQENCPCSFYSPITKENFGTKLFAEIKAQKEEEADQRLREKETYRQLKAQIDALVAAKINTTQIVELSILQLLDSLKEPEHKEINAEKVLEASKLSPQFFSVLALDVLSLYFEDETIGALCMLATSEVLKVTGDRPTSVYQQALKVLKNGKHFNAAAKLLPYYVDTAVIEKEENTLLTLLYRLEYRRFPGEPLYEQREYEHVISTLHHFILQNRQFMLSLFRKKLKVDDKGVRINCNGCLQDLLKLDSSFVEELLPELLKSLELTDDQYMDSADYATCVTIAKLIKMAPDRIYPVIYKSIRLLSAPARKEGLRLYSLLLEDNAFVSANVSFCELLVQELVQQVMKKDENDDVHDKIVDELNRLRYDQIQLLAPHFDALLGYFTQLAQDQKTFTWYKEELTTKKPEQISTFNPLQALNYFEVQHKEAALAGEMRDIKGILYRILRLSNKAHYSTLSQVLKTLDSKTDSKYKKELINIVATSLNDPLIIASQLPALYNYLFDLDSVEVRMEGVRFLERMIKDFPELITHTLLDLSTIFLKDTEAGVRGSAISLQATIADKMPEKITPEIIKEILLLMLDNYVYVHKTASRECIHFLSHMENRDVLIAVNNLITIEEVYKKKDKEFAQTVVKNMLRLSKKIPPLFANVVKNYLIPYCRFDEFYTTKEFIEILAEIKTEFHEFQNDWLQAVIEMFRKISSRFPNDVDWRQEFYEEMYHLPYSCIQRNLLMLESFLYDRKKEEAFDIIQVLHLLSYFELNETIIRYVSSLPTRIERVRSTEGLYKHAELIFHFCNFEVGLINGEYNKDDLKAIANALQNTESEAD